VTSNLGLVVSVARRYQHSGMPLADLIQDGNLGLLKAVERFDPEKGFRFSTYATWWIRHAIGRGVSDKARTVRVPVHVMEVHQKISKLDQELSRKLGRPPTREELANGLKMSVSKLEATLLHARSQSMSLDAPLGDDGDRERSEIFTDESQDQPTAYDALVTQALIGRARLAMQTLQPLEVDILHRRFGLKGESATTLQEIANSLGKSRERIRQIQEKALLKLRENLIAEGAV
jgi:RNA polymerase primary sigma factor